MVSKATVLMMIDRRRRAGAACAPAVEATRVLPEEVDPIRDAQLLRDLGLEPVDVVGVHRDCCRYGGADPVEVLTSESGEDTPDHYHPRWRKLSDEPVVGSGSGLDPANKRYRTEHGFTPF
jgi:hypothetical protein